MGRKPWTTPDQADFLAGFIDKLEDEKNGNGLKAFYAYVAQEFIRQWPSPIPQDIDRNKITDPAELKAISDERRIVQIEEWFKKRRRKPKDPSSHPKPIIDITGKSARKPYPLQPYQAYSARYFQPKDSLLRKEVDDLWKRRKQEDVLELLSPFMVGEASGDRRLFFHNSVMRWKCSKLSEAEKEDLQHWIDEEVERRWDAIKHPWRALQDDEVDDLTAENQYVQNYLNGLPPILQATLEEIERVTGLRSLLLIGGPIPARDGKVATHLYVTGRSRVNNLTFSKSWEGYGEFHDAFAKWLCTTYSDEERARRRGCSNDVAVEVLPGADGADLAVRSGPSQDNSSHVDGNTSDDRLDVPTNQQSNASPPQAATEDLPHPPPTSIHTVFPQHAIDTVAGDVRNPVAGAGAHSLPDPSPSVDETQDPPVFPVTSKQPALDNQPSPATTVPPTDVPPTPVSDDPPPSVSDDPPPPVSDGPPPPVSDGPPTPVADGSPTPVADGSPTPVANNHPPVGDNPLTPVVNDSGHSAGSPRAGIFTLDGSPTFITLDTTKFWEGVPGGERWVNMVQSYLRFEQLPTSKNCPARLATESRPAELSQWMKTRRYDDDHVPCVMNVDNYHDTWVHWWMASQPPWRRGKGWPLPKEQVENATWGKLSARGKHGLFLVVMSTTWWATSIKSADQRHLFNIAVDDIQWVIDQQLQQLPAPDAPAIEMDTSTTPEPDSSTVPSWLQRKSSKRPSRPSRRLLESLS